MSELPADIVNCASRNGEEALAAIDYIEVLNPTCLPRARKEIEAAARLRDLDGVVIGLLWNRKPNGDLLLRRIEERLSRSFSLKDLIRWSKPPSTRASRPAATELLDDMAARCHLVVNAIGD